MDLSAVGMLNEEERMVGVVRTVLVVNEWKAGGSAMLLSAWSRGGRKQSNGPYSHPTTNLIRSVERTLETTRQGTLVCVASWGIRRSGRLAARVHGGRDLKSCGISRGTHNCFELMSRDVTSITHCN